MLFVFTICGCSSATDIYFAAAAAGSNTGVDCAHAYAYNDGAHGWNTSASQQPGNTLHSCGTFTFAAGATPFAFNYSGSSGSPITLLFEPGSAWNAPHWGLAGFISANGVSYITVDGGGPGGTNGIVSATANGTGIAGSTYTTTGINYTNVSNAEIKNLNINGIYFHTCTLPVSSCTDDSGNQTPMAIQCENCSNFVVDYNLIHDAYAGTFILPVSPGTYSGISVHHNEIYHCNWSLNIANAEPGATLAGPTIHDNKMHDWLNWGTDNNANHHDGVFVFTGGSGPSSITGLQVFNNLLYGQLDAISGFIYIEDDSNASRPITTPYVFNNVVYFNTVPSSTVAATFYDWSTGSYFFNNTFILPSSSGANDLSGDLVYNTSSKGTTVRNNIIETCTYGLNFNEGGANVASSDYNDIYNCADSVVYRGEFYTLAAWTAANGNDANSKTTDPNLNANSSPPYQFNNTASPAYRTGANLTSYCETAPALCFDATGASRPSTGNWDMGAYYFTGASEPNPPTGLSASVQ